MISNGDTGAESHDCKYISFRDHRFNLHIKLDDAWCLGQFYKTLLVLWFLKAQGNDNSETTKIEKDYFKAH